MKKFVGTIAIIGKPNVGKSSLLNKIFNEKVSITNPKPQTTRNKISSNFVNDKYSIDFLDTPGFHIEKNKLDQFLNSEVKLALKEANIIYFLYDTSRPINDEDFKLLNLIKNYNIPIFLVATKADILPQVNNFQDEVNKLSEVVEFTKILLINTSSDSDVQKLLFETEEYLELMDENEIHYEQTTIQKDLFLVKEIIREQCLISLRQEVPYGVAVLIDHYEYNKNKNEFIIHASLNVEKESQKKILVGSNGNQIKEISINSRHELLKIFDAKIFLKLFVKVSKNWRDDEIKLKEFGYSN